MIAHGLMDKETTVIMNNPTQEMGVLVVIDEIEVVKMKEMELVTPIVAMQFKITIADKRAAIVVAKNVEPISMPTKDETQP